MPKKIRRKIRRPDELSNEVAGWKTKIARKHPFKLPIIHHLIPSERKMYHLAVAFQKLGLRFEESRNGSWFEVVKA